jgi:hypothetical protein
MDTDMIIDEIIIKTENMASNLFYTSISPFPIVFAA